MNIFDKLSQIKGLVLDIDGVFTDNSILVTEQGEFLRSMNVRDGYAIKRVLAAGLRVAILSGGKSQGTIQRMNVLGVQEVYLGVEDKLPIFENIVKAWNIPMSSILYMGDDLPDLECLKTAGVSACPGDAVPEVLQICEYISTIPGGKGCVRNLLEQILQVQGKWV